jgi:hypothetical protein
VAFVLFLALIVGAFFMGGLGSVVAGVLFLTNTNRMNYEDAGKLSATAGLAITALALIVASLFGASVFTTVAIWIIALGALVIAGWLGAVFLRR